MHGYEAHTSRYPARCRPAWHRYLARKKDIDWLRGMVLDVSMIAHVPPAAILTSGRITGLRGPVRLQSIAASLMWHALCVRLMCMTDIAEVMGRSPTTVTLVTRRMSRDIADNGWDAPKPKDDFSADGVAGLAKLYGDYRLKCLNEVNLKAANHKRMNPCLEHSTP